MSLPKKERWEKALDKKKVANFKKSKKDDLVGCPQGHTATYQPQYGQYSCEPCQWTLTQAEVAANKSAIKAKAKKKFVSDALAKDLIIGGNEWQWQEHSILGPYPDSAAWTAITGPPNYTSVADDLRDTLAQVLALVLNNCSVPLAFPDQRLLPAAVIEKLRILAQHYDPTGVDDYDSIPF